MLFFLFGAGALEFEGGGTQSLGNVFVGGEALEVHGVQDREHVESDVERRFGVVDQVADHGVVLAKIAVVGDETKDFVGEAGHGSEGFDFLIGEARRSLP